jgi:transposase-like protein
MLSVKQDAAAARRLFRKALSVASHPQPRVINTDLAPIYNSSIRAIKKEGMLSRRCRHRTRPILEYHPRARHRGKCCGMDVSL